MSGSIPLRLSPSRPIHSLLSLKLQASGIQLSLLQRGIQDLLIRKPRLNVQPKLLCVPQLELEFMTLEGHNPDGSDYLQRSILIIRQDLMPALFMNITTLPVQSIGRSSGCGLESRPRLSAKILFYNTSRKATEYSSPSPPARAATCIYNILRYKSSKRLAADSPCLKGFQRWIICLMSSGPSIAGPGPRGER